MAIDLRIMCWNIAEGSFTNVTIPNYLIPRIAEVIHARSPDLVLLNEVKNWDIWPGGGYGDYVRQVKRIAELVNLPYYQWANNVRTGITGHKAVGILSRFPLSKPRYHPVNPNNKFGTIESTVFVNGRTHQIFSLRFSPVHRNDPNFNWEEELKDNEAGHKQAIVLLQNLDPEVTIIYGGDFNVKSSESHFQKFVAESGLTNVFFEKRGEMLGGVDHLFYRGLFRIVQAESTDPECAPYSFPPSDHAYLFTVLSPLDEYFEANYGKVVSIKHYFTGNHLHSHNINYGHPNSSQQQQVTAFSGSDDNDFWRIKGPHGSPEGYLENHSVQDREIIRLEHVATRRNLHSHAGIPSPITSQQEVTAFGNNGLGDSNDDWRVEVEGGGAWSFDKRVRLIHINTNYALHSHAGFSDLQWTSGQQEVTCFYSRNEGDWWYLPPRRDAGVSGTPTNPQRCAEIRERIHFLDETIDWENPKEWTQQINERNALAEEAISIGCQLS